MALDFTASALIAAMLGAMAPGGAAADNPPIRLVSEAAGDGLRLKVVGSSDRALSADYRLEVSSESSGGTNRSVQSGGVRLQPGVPVTLVTLSLGSVKNGAWSARLHVTPKPGAAYEDVRTSADGPSGD
jgi:hypothetical protein